MDKLKEQEVLDDNIKCEVTAVNQNHVAEVSDIQSHNETEPNSNNKETEPRSNNVESENMSINNHPENTTSLVDKNDDVVIDTCTSSNCNNSQNDTENSKQKCIDSDINADENKSDHSPAQEQTKNESPELTEEGVSVCPDASTERKENEDTLEYRVKGEYISSSSDSDSSSSEDEKVVDDKESDEEETLKNKGPRKNGKPFVDEIKTKGELCLEDLPPLEELKITIDETTQLVTAGKVSSIVGMLVVIESSKDLPPLNEDTILFLEDRVAIGKVFEVFGPVGSPWYSVRFNCLEDINKVGLAVGTQVFCAPHVEDYTKYVFVNYLKSLKGSDASWEDNNEPPQKYIDYSDDEQEKGNKSKNRAKERNHSQEDQLPGAKKQRNKRNDKGQQQGFQRHNNTGQGWHDQNSQFSNGGQQLPRFGQRNYTPQRGNQPRMWPRGPRQEHFRNSGPIRHPTNFPPNSGTRFTNQSMIHPGYQHGNFTQSSMNQQPFSNGRPDNSYSNGQPDNSYSNGVDRQCDNAWSQTGSFQNPPPALVDHRFVQNSNNEMTDNSNFTPQQFMSTPPQNTFVGNYRNQYDNRFSQMSGPPPRPQPAAPGYPPRHHTPVFGGQPRFPAGLGYGQ